MKRCNVNLATDSTSTQKNIKDKVTALPGTDIIPANINITLTNADVVLASISIMLINTEAVPTNTGVAITSTDIVPLQKDIKIKLVEELLKAHYKTGTTAVSLTDMYAAVANSFGLSTKARDMENEITNDNVFKKRLRFAVLSLKHRGILDPNGQRGILRIMPHLGKQEVETLLELDVTAINAAIMNKNIKDSGI